MSLGSEFWVRIRKGEAVGLPFLGVVGAIGNLRSTAGTDMYYVLRTSQFKVQGSFIKDGYF